MQKMLKKAGRNDCHIKNIVLAFSKLADTIVRACQISDLINWKTE